MWVWNVIVKKVSQVIGKSSGNVAYQLLLTKGLVVFVLITILVSFSGLSVFAQEQVSSLNAIENGSTTTTDPKSKLTASEKKLDSELLGLINPSMLQGETKEDKKARMERQNQLIPAAEAVSQSSGKPAGDLVHVYVAFEPGADTGVIESYTWNVTGIDYSYSLMAAWVDVNNLRGLASLSEVRNIEAVVPPVVNVVSQGDAIHRSIDVRSLYGKTGAGMKIGVISDGVDSLSTSVANGELPDNVHVLSNEKGGDEGTAILEIVHDLAPDAELYFHDYSSDWLGFNQAVDELANNGSTVIIDDIAWYTTPFFEDGIIASNLTDQVNNKNIVYVTSADNFAQGHYQGMYYDDGTGHADLSHGTSSNKTIYYDIPANGFLIVVLEWNDLWGASSNDYDIYLRNSTGSIIAGSAGAQTGTQSPIEYFAYTNSKSYTVQAHLDIENYSAIEPRMLEIMTIVGGNYARSNNTNKADSIFGQAAASNVIAAGAIRASDPGNDDIEYFSSQGPVTIYYPSYEVRSKPDVCGIDGVSISGAGGFPNPFYGTSAAAPHVGAIAALTWSAYPTESADDIRNWMQWSAVDLGTSGYDGVFGDGRADALNMFLLPNGTVTGYVNITGTIIPISNVNVNLVNASDTSQVIASTTTDSNGIFTFNNIRSLGRLPKYKLSMAKAGFYDNNSVSFGITPDIANWVNASMVNSAALPVIQLNATAYTVNENASTLYVNVTRANDYGDTVGVTLTTISGTATSPTDYTAVTTPVTFASGQMYNLIPITINDDHLFSQQTKQFSVQLSDPTGASSVGTNQSAIVTIAETDPAPIIYLRSSTVNADESTGNLVINVYRSNDATNSVNAQWNIGVGNPRLSSSNGMVTFDPGVFSQTITIPIADDHLYLNDSVCQFHLSSPIGGAVLNESSQITLHWADMDAVPVLQFSDTSYSVYENKSAATITVTRLNDAINPITLQYNTSDGIAKAGLNYTATNGTLTFNQGEMSQTIQVPLIGSHRADETFNITLSKPTGGATLGLQNETTVKIIKPVSTYTFDLKQGWNIISIPFIPQQNGVTDVFPPTAMDDIEVIWMYNTSESSPWSYYTPRTDIYEQGTLTSIDEKHGYYVYCNTATSFEVSGTLTNETIALSPGWNIIGNPSMTSRAPWDVYSGFEVIWEYDGSNTASPWSYYTPRTDIYEQGSLTSLKPGFGYLIYV